jgi:hypothetical protein
MATNIFNYNGTKLTTVPDGRIDTTSASIKFPGYGYINYGEAVNENMLWIMQNFAGSTPPTNPTLGQTWYDTSAVSLKVFDGTNWTDATGISTGPTQPVSPADSGSLWFDTVNKQLNVYSGSSWLLVGPLGSANNTDPVNPAIPTYNMIDAARISDGTTTHSVWRLSLGGILLAIMSVDTEFIPIPNISGFSTIKPGLNLNGSVAGVSITGDLTLFRNNSDNVPSATDTYDLGTSSSRFKTVYATKFNGIATSAEVATSAGTATIAQNSDQLGGIDASKFLRTNQHNIPDTNLAYDLGSQSQQWKTVYAGNLVLNGVSLSTGNIVSISGTANQVIVTGTANAVLSLPQSIAPASSVRFSSIGLNQAAGAAGSLTFGDGTMQSTAYIPGTGYNLNSSPPPSNINLSIGQKIILNFTNLTNLPLYTACSQGIYKVYLVCTQTNSPNVTIEWFPNSVLTPSAISDEFETTGILTNTASGGFSTTPIAQNNKKPGAFYFDLVNGPNDAVSDKGPFMAEFIASTYTAAKMIKASTIIALGSSINNSMWLNGIGTGSGSARLNTTTAWTSLGVIRFEPSASPSSVMTGTVVIERLA